jgi:hypothetical protein
MSAFEPEPVVKAEEPVIVTETMHKCEGCKKEIILETAIPCEWCYREFEEELGFTLGFRPDDKEEPLFCKKCTLKCDACNIRGCKECVEFVCCDCDYNMCKECRNSDVDCGCYGECYSCGRDVNRGSEGWPCGECEKWYCDDCRRGDNPCKECGPEPESESEEESDEEEEPVAEEPIVLSTAESTVASLDVEVASLEPKE